MRREKKSVLLSLFLACSIFFTSEFGTLAADSQSEAQAIKTINHEVTISPLAETMEQIPEVAEKAAKKALKEKRAKIRAAKRRAARKAAREKGLKVIWALSLPAKVAPLTSAEFIKETLYHVLKEL